MKDEIKKLIEVALTDGVLTVKEREVILKKAVALGEDPDEVEIYIEAELQKVEKTADAAIRQAKGKACPYCGGPIPQLTDKCPHCGQFITAQASEELQEILEGLEEALVDMKSGENIERSKALVEEYARMAELYYSNNPKIQILLRQVKKEVDLASSKAVSMSRKKTISRIIFAPLFWASLLAIFLYIKGQQDIEEKKARLEAIPETHRESFFSKKTPWEKAEYDYENAGFLHFMFIPLVLIPGIVWQVSVNKRHRKEDYYNL